MPQSTSARFGYGSRATSTLEGSRNRRTTTKRVKAAPKSMAKMTKLIKAIQLKEQETNYKSITANTGTLNHDGIYELPIWNSTTSVFPDQGTTDGARIGDRIYAKSIRIRMAMDVPWDRKNVKVKAYYLPYNSDQGTPTSYNSLFHNITGNSRLDPIQFKRWKGLKYLGTFTSRDNDAGYWRNIPSSVNVGDPPANRLASNTASIYINKKISLNRKVWFPNDADNQPSNLKEKGSILLLPYATINTATTDHIILSSEGAFTLYYKDI
eukprot:TRINITY_DN8245_c0_g1_i1.p1 TRINITY_DN8245_c0_g1~~TRINITY_DN8245_c0_g1_i1.p1  ORF type:complete len:267 (-),score=22.96 TRINITY_DN8245_c0_g1_i1:844-1644(-)